MITRDEVLKINKQRTKAQKATFTQELDHYLATMAEHIRQGKFVTRENVFVRPIRGDREFQEAVVKILNKEGFNVTIAVIAEDEVPTPPPARKTRSSYQKVTEKYQLRLDLNLT
jgi:tRNA G26 N,N-dimethylase Trm1